MAAIRAEFSTASVGKALRELWSDDDLAGRDNSKSSSAVKKIHSEIQMLDEESKDSYI